MDHERVPQSLSRILGHFLRMGVVYPLDVLFVHDVVSAPISRQKTFVLSPLLFGVFCVHLEKTLLVRSPDIVLLGSFSVFGG